IICEPKKIHDEPRIFASPITVEHVGDGTYYGFMIDGNERFILGNFVVTHNTKICKALSEILQLPLFQISLGGMKDSSTLLGHDLTYVGSKCGRIADILKKARCMNPIIYFDELDKISSDNRSSEVYSTLTHILDETQDFEFTDLFFQDITLDLSKVFFIMSFNDLENIDPIVLNRIKIIKLDDLTCDDKVHVVENYILPELWPKDKKDVLFLQQNVIEHLVTEKTTKEPGMRNVKKNLESILNKLNTMLVLEKCQDANKIKNKFSYENLSIIRDSENRVIITIKMIDAMLKKHDGDEEWKHMYV